MGPHEELDLKRDFKFGPAGIQPLDDMSKGAVGHGLRLFHFLCLPFVLEGAKAVDEERGSLCDIAALKGRPEGIRGRDGKRSLLDRDIRGSGLADDAVCRRIQFFCRHEYLELCRRGGGARGLDVAEVGEQHRAAGGDDDETVGEGESCHPALVDFGCDEECVDTGLFRESGPQS